MTYQMNPQTKMGTIALYIRDMERSLHFYVDVLGFRIREQTADSAYLGAGQEDLVILYERPDAPAIEHQAGLYHYAILVPDRVELAKVLQRLIQTQTPVSGFADHLVSEAIYLPDPDGIGIEIYRDRPRSQWRTVDGHIDIGTEQLDLQSILDELTPENSAWNGMHPDTTIGHVHLNTGNNPNESKRFYVDTLGFEMIISMGGYWHFVAAGGYHHHLGLRPSNKRRNLESIGLAWYSIDLPDDSAVQSLVTRLESSGVEVTPNGNGYHFYDHANNGIRLHALS